MLVERFIDALGGAPSALVIEGEPGIGKTTLWLEALRAIETRGYQTLAARAAESEARLSYVALADLIAGVFDEARPRLPSPQAQALAAVLLRKEPNERADPRTTAAGLVSIVTALAAKAPLVIAVDDAQWLDSASARALEFGLDVPSLKTALEGSRRIVWMIIGMIKAHPTENRKAAACHSANPAHGVRGTVRPTQ